MYPLLYKKIAQQNKHVEYTVFLFELTNSLQTEITIRA